MSTNEEEYFNISQELLDSLLELSPGLAELLEQSPALEQGLTLIEQMRSTALGDVKQDQPADAQTIFHLFEVFLRAVQEKQKTSLEDIQALNWVREIAEEEDEVKRRELISKRLKEVYNQGFPQFFDFISTLGRINFPLSKDNLLFSEELEYEVFTEAIKVVQQQSNFEDWVQYVERRNSKAEIQESPPIDLRASVRRVPPKIEAFRKRASQFLNEHYPDEKYTILLKEFKKTIESIFGQNYEGYYTYGTTNAFTALEGRFWQVHPKAKMYYTPYEYHPMPNTVSADRREVLDMDLHITEEDFCDLVFSKAEADESLKKDDPIVILISSEPRGGGRKFDIRRIAQLIKAKNKILGCKRYHLWVDGAQDNSLFINPIGARSEEENEASTGQDETPEDEDFFMGDIVFYSKQFGGTGKGFVLVNKMDPEYAPNGEITYKLRESSGGGYNEDYLLDIMGALFVHKTKIMHRISDLVHSGDMWRYKGGGGYLDSKVKKALEYAQEHGPLFSQNFQIVCQNRPLEPHEFGDETRNAIQLKEWQMHRILRLEKNPESDIDLKKLQERLSVEHGIRVDCLSLDYIPEVQNLNYEVPLSEFVSQVTDIQKYNSGMIFAHLLPANRANLSEEEVKTFVRERIAEHEAIRVYLDVLHGPEIMPHLLDSIESILSPLPSHA